MPIALPTFSIPAPRFVFWLISLAAATGTAIPAHASSRLNVAILSPAALTMNVSTPTRAKPRTEAARPPQEPLRALHVVTAPGAGQDGYIHYWVITAPDGEQEIQVGIELPDRRIAWSFPELGVQVRPFIAQGDIHASGKVFRIQHHYGLRPFANDTVMRNLRSALEFRVAYWVDNNTPYCLLNGLTREICMSCMGFAMQVLFPGKTPAYPEVPRDFPRIGSDGYYTTEDLLLYLAGLHKLPTDAARRQQISTISGPQSLQEELIRLSALAADEPTVAEVGKPPAKRRVSARTPAPKPAAKRPTPSS
jgi:hypothetical protein